MRIWSIHPRYLDPQGLVALWREALLAQAVLRGRTKGYRRHPQLERFRAHASPGSAINAYLAGIHAEALRRGYSFDRRKIGPLCSIARLSVTTGQMSHEWQHLMRKLARRSPELHREWSSVARPQAHPIFMRVCGDIEAWEKHS